jgi:hypothetical protein
MTRVEAHLKNVIDEACTMLGVPRQLWCKKLE